MPKYICLFQSSVCSSVKLLAISLYMFIKKIKHDVSSLSIEFKDMTGSNFVLFSCFVFRFGNLTG